MLIKVGQFGVKNYPFKPPSQGGSIWSELGGSVWSEICIKFQKAKKILNNKSRDLAITQIIKKLIDRASEGKDFYSADSLIKDFKTFVSDTKYSNFIGKFYDSKLVLMPGSPAPEISLPDSGGKIINLSDFKGKIVVIDFWGTWCGPCKKQMPYSIKLQEHFKNRNDIEFVYVAMESKNLNGWKKYLQKEKIPGVHLYAEGNLGSETPKKYNISFAPHYVIIDKNGKIFKLNASHPSNKLKEEIEDLLK